jgi:hypothetical protein
MSTYYFEMADGTTVPIVADTEEEAYAKAEIAQQQMASGINLGRVAGLAGRAGVEGLVEGAGGLAALPADLLYNAGVAGMKGLDWMAGTDRAPSFGMPVSNAVAGAGDYAADSMRLPEPRTDNEKLAMAIGKGAISALPGLGIGGAMSAGSGAIRTAGNFLREGPVIQTLSGAAGNGSAEYAMQHGGNPTLAAIAGLAGGVGTAGGLAALHATGTALRPLTAGGRDRIVGDVLNMQAQNPTRAIQNMTTAPTYVPGSRPLAGVASGDPGLINLQRGVERVDTKKLFADNIEAANQARNDALAGVSMDEAAIDAASKARTAKADTDTAALFDTPQMRLAKVPVTDLMVELHRLKQDRRLYARQPVREALAEARNQIVRWAKRNKTTSKLEINPGVLYSIRQNIAQGLSGAIRSDAAPNIKLAGKTGDTILGLIDDKLEGMAPGFKSYMKDLAQSGEARKQGSLAHEAFTAGQSSGVTAINGGAPFLNLAALKRAYQQRRQQMSAAQRQQFEAVIADLDRSSKVNAPSIRSAGSDTAQNLAVQALLGRTLGGPIAQSFVGGLLEKPLNWVGKIGQVATPAVQDRMVEAMIDPSVAATLMRKSGTGKTDFAGSIANKAVQGSRVAGQNVAAAPAGWVVQDAQGNYRDIHGRIIQ